MTQTTRFCIGGVSPMSPREFGLALLVIAGLIVSGCGDKDAQVREDEAATEKRMRIQTCIKDQINMNAKPPTKSLSMQVTGCYNPNPTAAVIIECNELAEAQKKWQAEAEAEAARRASEWCEKFPSSLR